MEHKDNRAFFSNEALARFAESQGKTIQKIICHLWQNSLNKEVVEIIDNAELHFTDGHKITIACNENSDGLDVISFNYQETAKALHEEFGGKIKLFALDASSTRMWQDVIGKKLHAVQIMKEGENYLADSILLNFGEEKRTITVSPTDGLIIDYYEEV